jgi:hypothetical protein
MSASNNTPQPKQLTSPITKRKHPVAATAQAAEAGSATPKQTPRTCANRSMVWDYAKIGNNAKGERIKICCYEGCTVTWSKETSNTVIANHLANDHGIKCKAAAEPDTNSEVVPVIPSNNYRNKIILISLNLLLLLTFLTRKPKAMRS